MKYSEIKYLYLCKINKNVTLKHCILILIAILLLISDYYYNEQYQIIISAINCLLQLLF